MSIPAGRFLIESRTPAASSKSIIRAWRCSKMLTVVFQVLGRWAIFARVNSKPRVSFSSSSRSTKLDKAVTIKTSKTIFPTIHSPSKAKLSNDNINAVDRNDNATEEE